MLNAVLILLLRLILDCDANLDLGNPGFFSDRYFDLFLFLSYLSEKWVSSALKMTRRLAGSKGELILYFKSNFWAWVGKLRVNSVHRVLFHSLRQLSKLRRALLKLFTLGGNLFKLSLATYSVRFYKWIVRVRIWQVMPTGPNPAKISIPFPWKSPTAELLYYDFHITIKYISKTKYLRPKY